MEDITTLEDLVVRDEAHDCEGVGPAKVCVRVMAVADLPTRFGDFRIVAFWNNRDAKEHVAIVRGDILGAEDVPTRLHSECLTGDAIGSLRCDCRDQLETALDSDFQSEIDRIQLIGKFKGIFFGVSWDFANKGYIYNPIEDIQNIPIAASRLDDTRQ